MKKTSRITGGSRGIGAATAMLAAQRSYQVCINYLKNKEAALHVVDTINQLGRKAVAVQANVSPEKEVARAIVWLLSEEASYSTGTIIDITGGR